MNNNKLFLLRQKIDAIDTQILNLLNERAQIAQQVGCIKIKENLAIFRPERETQILNQVINRNIGPLHNFSIQTIFREIMSACRALEKKIIVAYLGPAGTFSEQAMHKQFGHAVEALACISINDVFSAAETGQADFGVVPIENSSEGMVHGTLDLLLKTTLFINGEISIPVDHNLMTQSGHMKNINHICAHSQALAQCNVWLNKNYSMIPRQSTASNAEAARIASLNTTIAAIASRAASQKYNLRIVDSYIQDYPNNRTRFVVVGRLKTERSGSDQTSIILSVLNKIGAIHEILIPLTRNNISMKRLKSRPARLTGWEYYFYIDLEGHQDDKNVSAALTDLKKVTAFFKLLGSYPCTL